MSTTATTPQLAGLQAGRIVNYVMANGKVRPFIIVEPWDSTGIVNGVLLFDGSNDKGNFAQMLGHVPDDISEADLADLQNSQAAYHPEIQGVKQLCAELIYSAPYSDTPKPGTWHWPKRDAIQAASVDPAALQTQLEALVSTDVEAAKADLLQQANMKIQALAESVQAALDEMKAEIQALKPNATAPAEAATATDPIPGMDPGTHPSTT